MKTGGSNSRQLSLPARGLYGSSVCNPSLVLSMRLKKACWWDPSNFAEGWCQTDQAAAPPGTPHSHWRMGAKDVFFPLFFWQHRQKKLLKKILKDNMLKLALNYKQKLVKVKKWLDILELNGDFILVSTITCILNFFFFFGNAVFLPKPTHCCYSQHLVK